MRTITAIQEARRMIRREVGKDIPDHLISFELTTEPDQYRVSYQLPRATLSDETHALVHRITLTPLQFEDWKRWKVARDTEASGMAESLRKMKEQINGND